MLDWTAHAEREREADGLARADVVNALGTGARIVEEYPDDRRGASVLVLGHLVDGSPVHALLGVAHGPWRVITVYRPDRDPKGRWTDDFTRRRG